MFSLMNRKALGQQAELLAKFTQA